MKIHSFWSEKPSDFESVVGESMTIPDQSLSVRDILMRFTRGSLVLPPVETGEDDDIDSAFVFEDMIDALEDVRNGRSLISELQNSAPPETSSDTSVEGNSE